MTRSRLRSPTSKSTTTTFLPPSASAAPSAAVEVVFPTPPLPDVTTSTLAIFLALLAPASAQRHDPDCVSVEPGLRRPTPMFAVHAVGGLVEPVDGEELGLELAAED